MVATRFETANTARPAADGAARAEAGWARAEAERAIARASAAALPVAVVEGDADHGAGLAQRLAGSWACTVLQGESAAFQSSAWNLGGLVALREQAPARRLQRGERMAIADQMDHYQLLVSYAATGLVAELQGETVKAGCGEPLLLDTARPAEITIGAGLSVQVFLPREALDELLAGPTDLHGLRLTGASATVLAEHLRSLTTFLPGLTSAQAPHAVVATRHIVAAAIAATPGRRAASGQESPLLRQACRYIELHLQERELSAANMGAALRVSRATLYRVFEAYGGVASHIRERRLARIRELLCAGRDRRPLARIAEDYGFESAAHFSHAFRQQYGHCPRDAASAFGAEPSAQVESGAANDPLRQWLRALRA